MTPRGSKRADPSEIIDVVVDVVVGGVVVVVVGGVVIDFVLE